MPLSSPVIKTYSKTGVSPAAKQRENDTFDMMRAGSRPGMDEKYSPSASGPAQDMELISFASPAPEQSINQQTKKEESIPNQRSRRSSRIKTPMK